MGKPGKKVTQPAIFSCDVLHPAGYWPQKTSALRSTLFGTRKPINNVCPPNAANEKDFPAYAFVIRNYVLEP
jgi:hypothetical protein